MKFALKYNLCPDQEIQFSEDEFQVNSSDLAKLNMTPCKNIFGEKMFLLKFDGKRLLLENTNDKRMPIYLKEARNKDQRTLEAGESCVLDHPQQCRVYLSTNNLEWDFLHFVQSKSEPIPLTRPIENTQEPSDEPIKLNYEDLDFLFEKSEIETKADKDVFASMSHDELDKVIAEYENIETPSTKNNQPQNKVDDGLRVYKKVVMDKEEESADKFVSEKDLSRFIDKFLVEYNNKFSQGENSSPNLNRNSKFAEYNQNNKRHHPYRDTTKEYDLFLSSYKTKRLKKAKDNKELKLSINATCAICLESITNLANLDKCVHDFCRSCIIEWSTNYTNLCPLCKKEFKKIIYYEKGKKKEVKVKKKVLKPENDEIEYIEEESSDICLICSRGDDLDHLLVCDSCHYNVCHTYCDGLKDVPDGDWYCRECRDYNQRNSLFLRLREQTEFREDEEDEDYAPRQMVDEEEEVAFKEFSREYGERRSEQDNNIITRRRTGRNNSGNNINVNINLNVNMLRGSSRNRSRSRENHEEVIEIQREGVNEPNLQRSSYTRSNRPRQDK